MKIAALILATVSAVTVKEGHEEVDMAVHVVTSTFGVEDEWLHIDQIVDHGTDDDHHDGGHVHGGTCEHVHVHYDNYLLDEENDEWESSHWY